MVVNINLSLFFILFLLLGEVYYCVNIVWLGLNFVNKIDLLKVRGSYVRNRIHFK